MAGTNKNLINKPSSGPSHLLTEEEYLERHLPALDDHPLADAYLRLQYQWLKGKIDYAPVTKAFDEYDEATYHKKLPIPGRQIYGPKIQGQVLLSSAEA